MYGNWYYSPDHGQFCQVIETQSLWGETICRVWFSGSDSVVRIRVSRLKPLDNAGTGSSDYIAYSAAAARVADALKGIFAFAARRRMIEKIGLPQVRNHRLTLLAQEEKIFNEQLDQKAQIYPDMVPLIMIRIGDL